MKRIRSLIAATSGMALMAGAAWAQDIGQPAQGRVLAQQICSECHSIEKTVARSPNPAAPRFEVIANTPGMTAIALTAAMQTSHRTMPNVILQSDEFRNVVAYILSLRQGN
jgi:mono/diheme cytochrome c family protein